MMFWETYLLAQRAIRRNVLRSSLTVLGIVIGVAAVIAMVTLGSGATAKVSGDISKLGSNMLHVRPGQGMRGPGGARASAAPFKVEDADAIEHTVAGLKAVAPTATVASQAISGSANWSTSVTGTTPCVPGHPGLAVGGRPVLYPWRSEVRKSPSACWVKR